MNQELVRNHRESSNTSENQRERLVRVLAATTFLIFFQAYMVAPLIPKLSMVFHVSNQTIGLIVPAYMIPYGAAVLFYGVLSDRIGRTRLIFGSLFAFVVLTAATATARTAAQLISWRFLTGIGASAVVPLSLAAIGTMFSYEQRGRPLGWLFGAMAGGMAFGSTFGALLEPFIGWRNIFLVVSALGLVSFFLLKPHAQLLGHMPSKLAGGTRQISAAYKSLLTTKRSAQTYAYVLLNAIFHSGVFTWLGVYFAQRHGLTEIGIGLALLGYGFPGFVLGPVIGRVADRFGRRWLIPLGLGIAAVSALVLIPRWTLVAGAIAVTTLSLGYDMTQPLFAGIVTSLDPQRAGQAMGLNVFCLFVGFGVGSLIFGEALRVGFNSAILLFALGQAVLALLAIPLFRFEGRVRYPAAA